MNNLNTDILRIGLLADRARTGAYASAAVALSQVLMRASVSPGEGATEAEQFGASMASGIVDALTAPLLYGSLALTALFTILAITYHTKLGRLQRAYAQPRPPQAPGFGSAPIPPTAWGPGHH